MKTLFLTILIFSAFASASSIPKQIETLNGKSGILLSDVIDESGLTCKITTSETNQQARVVIEAETYFPIVAYLNNSQLKITETGASILTAETGKRPGGSVCGDTDILLKYEKIVEVQNKILTIREQFRCFSDFGKKTEIVRSCKLI